LPKIALYVSAIVFALVALLFGLLFVFEVDVLVGRAFYRPISLLGIGVFSAVLAVWMLIASRDI
jgi:hypothetical protein